MSSVATRTFYAAWTNGDAAAAGGDAYPMFDCVTNGTFNFVSLLSRMSTAGARVVLKFVGAPPNYSDANSAYSHAMWKASMDAAFAQTTPAQIAAFVKSGTLLANVMDDDAQAGSTVFPGGTPTFAELDDQAKYSKSVWTTLPCCVRMSNTYMRDICVAAGRSQYSFVDFGWSQWVSRLGPVATLYQNNVNAGRQVGLGFMAGMNLPNGGSGTTAPWQYSPGRANKFGMSPDEIAACGAAFSAQTLAIGMAVYAQDTRYCPQSYWDNPDINNALLNVANKAIGRLQGPINLRDVSGSTSGSGSTATVVGSWALKQATCRRWDGVAGLKSLNNAPTTAGNLLGILAYSRDSNRSPALPSGWSEAKRISGSSRQGGELALFYKVANGSEYQQEMEFTGSTTATSDAVIGLLFEFSGNSALAGLLGVAGSARSWSQGTSSMGPVKGLTSIRSDALVLACVAKANDFNATNLPDHGVMSATTSSGEVWNRAIISGTAVGDDAGILLDYATTAGLASITTKSWSQLTQSDSGSSGAGCGFMVAFSPVFVTPGLPPVISDLADITMSVASTLAFTLTADGATPITWSKVSGPSNVTLNTSTGAFSWTPVSTGTYVHVLRATNAFGFDEDSFEVVGVGTGNVPPVVTQPSNRTVREGTPITFRILSTDSDGDTVTYALQNAPSGALIVEDSGNFVWTPSGSQGPGIYPIVVVVSDGQNASRSTFTIAVTDSPWTRSSLGGGGFASSGGAGNGFVRVI